MLIFYFWHMNKINEAISFYSIFQSCPAGPSSTIYKQQIKWLAQGHNTCESQTSSPSLKVIMAWVHSQTQNKAQWLAATSQSLRFTLSIITSGPKFSSLTVYQLSHCVRQKSVLIFILSINHDVWASCYREMNNSGFIQARLCKTQRLFKDF